METSNSLRTKATNFTKNQLQEAVSDYFKSDQWKTAFDLIRNPKIEHIHIFIDSRLNPYTIDDVTVRYLEAQGYHISHRPYHGAIQDHKLSSNIEPDDLPPFEFYSFYNDDVIMAAQRGREAPEVWTNEEVQAFINHFEYVEATPRDRKECLEYFMSSDHWVKAMKMVQDPDMEHLHINIESKLHPDVIRDCMLESFVKKGWDLNKIVHMIFSPSRLPKDQKRFYGKLMVMLRRPPVTRFDVAWIVNKNTTIRPATEFISDLNGVPELDIGGTKQMVQHYISLHPFQSLTGDEVAQIFK
jgi:hypothetical protein